MVLFVIVEKPRRMMAKIWLVLFNVFCAVGVAASSLCSTWKMNKQHKGIKEAETIDMNATITRKNNTFRLDLKCSTYRQPIGDTLHILFNYTSIDFLTYSSGKCFRTGRRQCENDTCTCSHDENRYMYVWSHEFAHHPTNQSISCEMDFCKYNGNGVIRITKTVKFNNEGDILEDEKNVTNSNVPTGNQGENGHLLWILLAVPVLIIISLFVVCKCWRDAKNHSSDEETTPFINEAIPIQKCEKYTQTPDLFEDTTIDKGMKVSDDVTQCPPVTATDEDTQGPKITPTDQTVFALNVLLLTVILLLFRKDPRKNVES